MQSYSDVFLACGSAKEAFGRRHHAADILALVAPFQPMFARRPPYLNLVIKSTKSVTGSAEVANGACTASVSE